MTFTLPAEDLRRLFPGGTSISRLKAGDAAIVQAAVGAASKAHKYLAQWQTVDGIKFQSMGEATRHGELLNLERAGAISLLRRQVAFVLHAMNLDVGELVIIGEYRADFGYADLAAGGAVVIEDFKGFRTPLYRWKKKHVEAEYGVRIIEVTARKGSKRWNPKGRRRR